MDFVWAFCKYNIAFIGVNLGQHMHLKCCLAESNQLLWKHFIIYLSTVKITRDRQDISDLKQKTKKMINQHFKDV